MYDSRTMKLNVALCLLFVGSTTAFVPLLRQQARPVSSMKGSNSILDQKTGRSQLDPAVIDRYNSLAFPEDTLLAEYVWVDADGNTRSKTRTLPAKKVSRSIYRYPPMAISLSL